jgi:hypothetical protein
VLAGRYPLAGPYPFGHETVAEVVLPGPEVTTVEPGPAGPGLVLTA